MFKAFVPSITTSSLPVKEWVIHSIVGTICEGTRGNQTPPPTWMDPQSALIFPGDFMPGSRQNCIVKEMLIGIQCAINIYFSIASLSSLQFYNWILSCESFDLQTPWPPCYQLLVTNLDQWSFWDGTEIIMWNVSYKKIRAIDQIIFSFYNVFCLILL